MPSGRGGLGDTWLIGSTPAIVLAIPDYLERIFNEINVALQRDGCGFLAITMVSPTATDLGAGYGSGEKFAPPSAG